MEKCPLSFKYPLDFRLFFKKNLVRFLNGQNPKISEESRRYTVPSTNYFSNVRSDPGCSQFENFVGQRGPAFEASEEEEITHLGYVAMRKLKLNSHKFQRCISDQ